MKKLRQILAILAFLLVILILSYAATIFLSNPLAGKDREMAVINLALHQIGLAQPTWQTVVVAASQEVDLPCEVVWAAWTQLEDWPTWSRPLHVSTRWLGSAEWQEGSQFEQDLNLGFPLGLMTSTEKVGEMVPGQQVMWWKDENGVKSCHIWTFESLPDGRTRITNVEVFHGVAMGGQTARCLQLANYV